MQQLEKLIAIFGRGNLLEAIFIFLGGFQNMISHNNSDSKYIDHRNFFHLHGFINKTETQCLDQYFKLMLSLQGLCLVYKKAYKILSHHNNLSTQEVIDEIYVLAAVNQELTKIVKMVDKEKDKSIKLLNMIVNPKGESPFNSIDDFEMKVLKDIRELVSKIESTDYLNGTINSKISRCLAEEEEKQSYKVNISLYKALIKLYCQINSISISENLILALILTDKEAQCLSDNPPNKCLAIRDKISNEVSSAFQMLTLARFIQLINISGEKYAFNNENIDRQSDTVKTYVKRGYTIAGISKDTLIYLINSDDQDLAKKFEDKVLADAELDIEHGSKSSDEERFEDASDVKSETFEQKVCNSSPVEFNKRRIFLCTTASLSITFTTLLLSSILGKFLHNKYNIAALAILGTATLALSAFTFCYLKIQQQKPLSELDQIKVGSNENKEMSNSKPIALSALLAKNS